MNKRHCIGCKRDGRGCGCRDKARLEPLIPIRVDDPPPHRGPPAPIPSCYRAHRYMFVSPTELDKRGYFK